MSAKRPGRLIKVQARRASSRSSRTHRLDVKRFLPQDLVNVLARRMIFRLRLVDRRMIGVIWLRRTSASAGGSVAASRSTRTNTLGSQ